MAEDAMTPDEVAKRAMELAARAEELARNAHETAGIDEQLAQLEAELDALDAEESGVDRGSERPADSRAETDPLLGWAGDFTERVGSLGDRIGALVEQVTEATLHSVESSLSRDGEVVGQRTLPVSGPCPVQIDSDGGSVRINGHDQPEVSVVARGRRQTDQDWVVDLEERDGVVQVRSRSRRRWRGRGVRLEIHVPTGSPLKVSTGGGSVTVRGVAAAADVRTGGGSISLSDVRGHADVLTGGGSIILTDFDGALTAKTGGGSIRIAGRLAGTSSVQTGGGSIVIHPAAGTNVTVDAHGTGALTDVDGLQAARGHITGRIGDGGDGELHASTGGGSIRIVR